MRVSPGGARHRHPGNGQSRPRGNAPGGGVHPGTAARRAAKPRTADCEEAGPGNGMPTRSNQSSSNRETQAAQFSRFHPGTAPRRAAKPRTADCEEAWSAGQFSRWGPPTGIARERETSTDDVASCQPDADKVKPATSNAQGPATTRIIGSAPPRKEFPDEPVRRENLTAAAPGVAYLAGLAFSAACGSPEPASPPAPEPEPALTALHPRRGQHPQPLERDDPAGPDRALGRGRGDLHEGSASDRRSPRKPRPQTSCRWTSD